MAREPRPTRLKDALDWALVGAPLGLGLLLAGLLTFFSRRALSCAVAGVLSSPRKGAPMADACTIDSANVQAFLKLIRYAEHFPNSSDDFYLTLYGGGRFTDTSKHPHLAVTRWGHTSNAAGAYQILYSTWLEAKQRGVVSDFTPASQDRLAFGKIQSRHALDAVCAGDVPNACQRLALEWTSLPGGAQTRMTLKVAQDAFVRFGGKS